VSRIGNANASIWIVEPDRPEPLRKLLDLPISVVPRGITWNSDSSGLIIAYQEPISDMVLFDLTRQ